jgi:drug/metabolite transporter (DMT)-like permease
VSKYSNETSGLFLVCLSAITFSTAGIFTKSVEASAWDVIFWRGLSGAAFTFGFLTLRADVKGELRRFGMPALFAAILGASGTAAFIPAFKLTSVANVSLIWATAPFVTAILAWLFIRETPTTRTIVFSLFALLGVVIMVNDVSGVHNHIGNLLAFWMTLMIAAMLVLYRAWPETPTKIPAALSSLILLPFAVWFSEPSTVSGAELGILVAFGLVFAAASVLLAEGARLVPSAKAALISALETPLAPLWAILILAEWPEQSTVLGGAIIILAVVFSQKYTRNLPPEGIGHGYQDQ